MRKIGLVAVGTYVPEQKLTNQDLERMVDTTDEWITTRTGIKERRIAPDQMHASDLAAKAAAECLAQAPTHYQPQLLIAATSTAEKNVPNQASLVAQKLNLSNLAAFDLNAACSGLVYALAVGWSLMRTEGYDHTLITAGKNSPALSTIRTAPPVSSLAMPVRPCSSARTRPNMDPRR